MWRSIPSNISGVITIYIVLSQLHNKMLLISNATKQQCLHEVLYLSIVTRENVALLLVRSCCLQPQKLTLCRVSIYPEAYLSYTPLLLRSLATGTTCAAVM